MFDKFYTLYHSSSEIFILDSDAYFRNNFKDRIKQGTNSMFVS